MNKKLIIISLALILVGFITSAIGLISGGSTQLAFGTGGITLDYGVPMTINTSVDEFHSIDIDLSFISELEVIESDYFGIDATYYETDGKISYNVQDGRLVVTQDRVNHFMGLNFFKPTTIFTLHVPKGISLNDIKITTEASRITIENRKANNIYIKNAFGKTTLESIDANVLDVQCESGSVVLDTIKAPTLSVVDDFGNIKLRDIVSDRLNVVAESGSISLYDVNTSSLEVSNDFGKTELAGIVADELDAKNESGSFSISDSVVSQSTIENSFGSVEVKYKGNLSDYNYNLSTDFGSIKVNGEKQGNNVNVNQGAPNHLTINCDSGSVDVHIK